MAKKCKTCKGRGTIFNSIDDKTLTCPACEGLGVPLQTEVEEQFEEASEFDGSKLHPDEDNYIDVE